MRRALWLWGPVAAYLVAIFLESSVSQVPELPTGVSDKDAHGFLYAGMALLILRALAGARPSERGAAALRGPAVPQGRPGHGLLLDRHHAGHAADSQVVVVKLPQTRLASSANTMRFSATRR